MAVFKCKVLDAHNKTRTEIYEADDDVQLKALLRREGVFLVEAILLKEKKTNTFFAVSSKIKKVEVISFLRQFAVMVKAGIPISNCISTLRKQKFGAAFLAVLQQVHYDIMSGVLLSDAFAKHPKAFPQFFVSMVAIGEASGSLDKVLASMADYYENDRKIKNKAKSSMVYPTLLLIMTLVIVMFLNLFILPKFQETLKDFGGEMPQITVIVMSISEFMVDYAFIIIPAIAAVVLLSIAFFKTETGKYVKDVLMFNLPIIGKVQRSLITARFAKAFIILLESGMNMVDCLENLKRMLGNQVFSSRFEVAIEEVKRGKRIAQSLAETKLFPDMLSEMINVGEQSGNIEEVLQASSAYFDECVETAIQKAIASLEPIMIALLGVVVGVVILSVLTPMISMMGSIG